MEGGNNIYSNADSFAMAFDEAWKKYNLTSSKEINKEEKMKNVINKINDHPFFLNNPKQAFEVAKFRMSLLNLK